MQNNTFLCFRFQLNILLLNCGLIGIIEVIFNCLTSVIYIMTQPWQLGQWSCNINSFIMEFVPVMYSILLVLLALDRYIAVRDPTIYRKNHSQSKIRIALCFYWVLALSAITPLLIGVITNLPFPDRYSCQVRAEENVFCVFFAFS